MDETKIQPDFHLVKAPKRYHRQEIPDLDQGSLTLIERPLAATAREPNRPLTPAMIEAFADQLCVLDGPLAGEPVRLAQFQRDFIAGAFTSDVTVAALSVARGNGKTTLAAMIAMAELIVGRGPRRHVVVVANTQPQAAVLWDMARSMADQLSLEQRSKIRMRESPRHQIEYEHEHRLTAVAGVPRALLGLAPTVVIMDERGSWRDGRGEEVEAALMTGAAKRSGKVLMLSTSAATNSHAFSRWIDDHRSEKGVYIQEHRATEGLPIDDEASILEANPGVADGIGPTMDRLQMDARVALRRGASAINAFRLFNRNERVAQEVDRVLLTLDEWSSVEVESDDDLPARDGPCAIGVDLGGPSSMSAAALYWYRTGRLEVFAAWGGGMDARARGDHDGVGALYEDMVADGDLTFIGDGRVIDLDAFLAHIQARLTVNLNDAKWIVHDRYRTSEFRDAIARARWKIEPVARGMGWYHAGPDTEAFRRATFEGHIRARASALMRNALANAALVCDPAGNVKIHKVRSKARIDALSAAILAVAFGRRKASEESAKAARPAAKVFAMKFA